MIFHNKPFISNLEKFVANQVLDSNKLTTGYQTSLFEKELCNFLKINKENIVVCSSGSAALFLALWAVNAQKKSVSYPAYVCSAVRNAVNLIKAKHEVVDIFSDDSPNVTKEVIQKSKSKIFIAPHMYGIPIDLSKVKNKIIIEDCCHSLGAKINNKSIGLTGNISILSFYTTKLITSGGHGGAVFSKDKNLINKIRDYLDFDQRKDLNFRFNFKMNEINAAIGREQLKKLNFFIKRREKIFKAYNTTGHTFLDCNNTKFIKPVRYRAVILEKKQSKLIKYLKKKNILSINPLQDWEILGNVKNFKNSLNLSKKTVSIPIYPAMSDYQYRYIVKSLREF